MAKFDALLKKKVLGVPVSYLAALGVAILAYYAYKVHDASATTTDTASTDGTSGTDSTDADATDGTADTADFTANPAPTYDTTTATTTTVATNASWESAGIQWAIAQGLGTAGTVQGALDAYLNGDQTSYAQGAIRDAVIKQFGPPPDLPTSGGTAAKPASRQGTPPLTHTVQSTTDNTFTKLAQLYYGNTSGDRIDLLQINNMGLGAAGPWAVGTRVFIPKYTAPVYQTAKKGLQTLHEFAAKNGKTSAQIQQLNDSVKFPVKIGARVRVA